MKRDEIERRMTDLMVQQVAIEHQIQGLRRMHDSAVLVNQMELASQYREQIHTATDALLDAANSVMLLTRQLATLPP